MESCQTVTWLSIVLTELEGSRIVRLQWTAVHNACSSTSSLTLLCTRLTTCSTGDTCELQVIEDKLVADAASEDVQIAQPSRACKTQHQS